FITSHQTRSERMAQGTEPRAVASGLTTQAGLHHITPDAIRENGPSYRTASGSERVKSASRRTCVANKCCCSSRSGFASEVIDPPNKPTRSVEMNLARPFKAG